MAHYKLTMRINWGQVAGWSETFYYDSDQDIGSDGIRNLGRSLMSGRAICLTRNATILDCLISIEGSPGVTRTVIGGFPGSLGTSSPPTADGADIVMACLQVNFRAGTTARRAYMMRGMVDADIVGGIVTFAASSPAPFIAFLDGVVRGNGVRLKDRTIVSSTQIVSVSGAGLLTVVAGSWAPIRGQTLTLSTRVAGGGRSYNSVCRVLSVNTGGTFNVTPWSNGNCEGGLASIISYAYTDISSAQFSSPNRAKTRRTGRPFGLLRGKQARRQRSLTARL